MLYSQCIHAYIYADDIKLLAYILNIAYLFCERKIFVYEALKMSCYKRRALVLSLVFYFLKE